MVMTVSIKITGDINMAELIRTLPIAAMEGAQNGAAKVAEIIANRAKMFAPKETRALVNAITWGKTGQNSYGVFLNEIPDWGARGSAKARLVYPIAQERSYARHRIHVDMMPESARDKYRWNFPSGFLWVSGFTPFMVPAFATSMNQQNAAIIKQSDKAFNKYIKRVSKKRQRLLRFGGV